MMSQADKQQQQDIIYTNDAKKSMCFLLPLARGCLITLSQCLSSPPLTFTAILHSANTATLINHSH